jgi:hypothetical protein
LEANFAIVFTWLFSRHKRSLVVLKIVEWKMDTAMMMCKKSIDDHLFNRDIIDFGGKQCTLFSPICRIFLFGNYAIVSYILSSSKCQFYRRWTSGKCLTCLMNALAGAAGQCKRIEPRGKLYQSLKIIRLRLIYSFVCFVGIHIQKTWIVFGGVYVMDDTSSCRGFWRRSMWICGRVGIDICHGLGLRCAELLHIIFRMHIHEYSMTLFSGKYV